MRTDPPFNEGQLQTLYETLLRQDPRDERATVALGFAFGEALRRRADLAWMFLTDDAGSEIVLAPPDRHLAFAPVTMIRKRLLRGEWWDLPELAGQVADGLACDRRRWDPRTGSTSCS